MLRKACLLACAMITAGIISCPRLHAETVAEHNKYIRKLRENPFLSEYDRAHGHDIDKSIILLATLSVLVDTPRNRAQRSILTPSEDEQQILRSNPSIMAAYTRNGDGTLRYLRSIITETRNKYADNSLSYKKRSALVISAQNKEWRLLKYPDQERDRISLILAGLGFYVIRSEPDPGKSDILRMIRDFIKTIGPDTTALLYFTGHGASYNGIDYLVPSGAPAPQNTTTYARSNLVQLNSDILSPIILARGLNAIVILDTCRTEYMPRHEPRSTAPTPRNTNPYGIDGFVTLQSTQPREKAFDYFGHLANSPFSNAFTEQVDNPTLEFEELVLNVIRSVYHDKTKGEQFPEKLGSLSGDFYFSPADKLCHALATDPDDIAIWRKDQSLPWGPVRRPKLAISSCKEAISSAFNEGRTDALPRLYHQLSRAHHEEGQLEEAFSNNQKAAKGSYAPAMTSYGSFLIEMGETRSDMKLKNEGWQFILNASEQSFNAKVAISNAYSLGVYGLEKNEAIAARMARELKEDSYPFLNKLLSP